MRAYNQYGWLLASNYNDFTLTCEPASLGTISADGKTFIASAAGGTGTLTARSGNITCSKPVTVMAGEVSVRLANLLTDNRDYPIEVVSTAGDRSYAVDPAMLSWSVADPEIASVSAAGALRGLKNGQTTVTGTLGESQTSMNVTVQIPEDEVVSFLSMPEAQSEWTLQNNYGPINWIYSTPGVDEFAFTVNSARGPQVKMLGSLDLYGLPDSLMYVVKSVVDLKSITLTAQPANASVAVSSAKTPVVAADGTATVLYKPSDFGADAADIATYPINLQAVTFTLQNVKVNTEYTIALHDILLYYHNTQKTALPNLPATETTARKFIHDGQLLIEKDGVVYTATGVRLNHNITIR